MMCMGVHCTWTSTCPPYLRSQTLPDIAGEKEQRIVSLTAQLTTARMKEAVSERRYPAACLYLCCSHVQLDCCLTSVTVSS